MANYIIFRLHPIEPVAGNNFTEYLNGLAIRVFDLSFDHPEGALLGQATFLPGDPDESTIVQHMDGLERQAVATAWVEIPDDLSEYQTADVRLEIERDGLAILNKSLNYNVQVAPIILNPQSLPPSLYVPLPAPGLGIGPDDAYVDMPTDGSPPNFIQLKAAVETVLEADPGNTAKLDSLTAIESKHIAYEIVWNRKALPLPLPEQMASSIFELSSLEAMYTLPQANDEEVAGRRNKFEAALLGYYNINDAAAERLTPYVYALSAAIFCEELSEEAEKARFTFPIRPDLGENPALLRKAEAFLAHAEGGNLEPSFAVPAPYFYALGAGMLPAVSPIQRYRLAYLSQPALLVEEFKRAIESNAISDELSINPFQAARRLNALDVEETTVQTCPIQPGSPAYNLVQAWLDYNDEDISEFWADSVVPTHEQGHLSLVLCMITKGHQPLIDAINAIPVASIADLAGLSEPQWTGLFLPDHMDLLPPQFQIEGTEEEQVGAFIRYVKHFFSLPAEAPEPEPPEAEGASTLGLPDFDPFAIFAEQYSIITGSTFAFGESWVELEFQAALAATFPDDECARGWLEKAIRIINALYKVVADVGDEKLRFSLVEALYARGFTSEESIAALTLGQFREALTGTIAYDHASPIYMNAGGTDEAEPIEGETFTPVNPDGTVTNCIPPRHLSPLGPVAYLHELLELRPASDCETPFPGAGEKLESFLADRRGSLGSLHASYTNLNTPIPMVDLALESLEAMVAKGQSFGQVYNTSTEEVGGHLLLKNGAEGQPKEGPYHHEPATLLDALPEHSSPAAPMAEPDAYSILRNDFSAPGLPYNQPLDVNRTYLGKLGTSRFDTMRTFRKDITELVLDPTLEPPDFQRHLWRYPVRFDIALEYLHISPEEYDRLFAENLSIEDVQEMLGFAEDTIDGLPWQEAITALPEFLTRTGLSYCEFYELWQARYIKFRRKEEDYTFPECEPCCLDDYHIEFTELTPLNSLKRLLVFIRLWRILHTVENAAYPFVTLGDICLVLQLFSGGNINPEFIRQLAAFQMLRDDYNLMLKDDADSSSGTEANRTHLLALWENPAHPKWEWAVGHLLDRIQQHTVQVYRARLRPPEFIKLLKENLGPLSELAGFNPALPSDTWHAAPTHTLRFAEILSKIYTSKFSIEELFFILSSGPHLRGIDPFPLQSENEAKSDPFELPDDEEDYSLWKLREKLLRAEVGKEEIEKWTWQRIVSVMYEAFGYRPPADVDHLESIGQHFFPGIMEAEGIPVSLKDRQYRWPLEDSPPAMWNTPLNGPFRYDTAAKELWAQLPLADKAVLEKLSRIRQLKPAERNAVQQLYLAPRVSLSQFAFLYGNLAEAEKRLIEEADEQKRWAYFRWSFVRCYTRCQLVAAHLAGHVEKATRQKNQEGIRLAWAILRHLYADENFASVPWESDGGTVPDVTWLPQPSGSAFAALLGLAGTGLPGWYSPAESDEPLWQELRGPMEAFGAAENAYNAPVPLVIPSMNLTFTPEQEKLASVRNGFALSNKDGEVLGGAQSFKVAWKGLLLIEKSGQYTFRAGLPASEGEIPDFEHAAQQSWRVAIDFGQREFVLLSHNWPGETAPGDRSLPLKLDRGTYELRVEFIQPAMDFDDPDDVRPQHTGFQLKYHGPDTNKELTTIPFERLYAESKLTPRESNMPAIISAYFSKRYYSTVRDIRRTYLRAFKALALCHLHQISAQPAADDGQSEIGYLLAHQEHFLGRSYYRSGDEFDTHKAFFNFNFLPVLDQFYPPDPSKDQRALPSVPRKQALFDGFFERLFDYTVMRKASRTAREFPVWFLFHEAAEVHPDPIHLTRHLDVDRHYAPLVLRYFEACELSSAELEDERWAIRVWHADQYINRLVHHFAPKDIREGRPDLWASDDPAYMYAGESEGGNAQLTRFVRDGLIENGEPRRYKSLKMLNDGLRERAHRALLTFLCGMDRVALPWGGFVTHPKQLSELLLLDVEAGLCQKASRIEEAVSTVRAYVARNRIGLEAAFPVSKGFAQLWDLKFSIAQVWEACKQHRVYKENWVEWDELEKAREHEAFRFLEDQLRRQTLTVPVPGGLEYWPVEEHPAHTGILHLQERAAALLDRLTMDRDGFNLMGKPERAARPSWLSNNPPSSLPAGPLPYWIEAAVELSTKFIRVAAASEASGAMLFESRCQPNPSECCCAICGRRHEPTLDEYYFWVVDASYYEAVTQHADWSWHDADALPSLLFWKPEPTIYLAWSRLHNGEFQPLRWSSEGIRVDESEPDLLFSGRTGDSLYFEVESGLPPAGYPASPNPGFRYDIAPDTAEALPEVVAPEEASCDYPGGLCAYPYFAFFEPGAPIFPLSTFSPVIALANQLIPHCRYEDALNWYKLEYNPLERDNTWCSASEPSVISAPDGSLIVDDEAAKCCQNGDVSCEVARRRLVLLSFLETLLKWGNALMQCKHSPEAFQQARLIFDTAAKILGEQPQTIYLQDNAAELMEVSGFTPFPPALNPRLVALYEKVKDRLALIHSCLDEQLLRNGQAGRDMKYWGDTPFRDGWKTEMNVCGDDNNCCCPDSPYRFTFLINQAQGLASEVRVMGNALLAAYEKGDAEYLAALRAGQERQLLKRSLTIRQNQWREADWQLQALKKAKEVTQTQLLYYQTLIENGLNAGEQQYKALTEAALGLMIAARTSEFIAQIAGVTPDMWVGNAGPLAISLEQVPAGSKLASVFSTAARISNSLAETATTTASLRLTEAGWERREEDWIQQVDVLTIEIQRIERQILAAERQRDIALQELNNHQVQVEQAATVQRFLRDKFTNQELYLWLQRETAALYYQMYELALCTARQAQRAYNFEQGFTTEKFIDEELWDNLHEGLLTGDRLQLALQVMEQSYLDKNHRQYEISKHISMRAQFPLAMLQLKTTGYCEIELPEWMFDLDYPGQYMRRIKNVSLSIPAVVGPYTSINCRLTLLSSKTRIDPRLAIIPGECCDAPGLCNGYQEKPDDPRIVRQYGAREAIATSNAQNDSGMFELNFRDERYLPFEFSGAISTWRIELPVENNFFDLNTINDLIIHLNYTAREGGGVLRQAANEAAQSFLPREGLRFFDVKHEMPDAWRLFREDKGQPEKKLGLWLNQAMFPYLPNKQAVTVNRLELFFQAVPPYPEDEIEVNFNLQAESSDKHDNLEIYCRRGDEPADLYHGVLELETKSLNSGKKERIGEFVFPRANGDILNVFLFCRYEVS